MRQDRTVLFVLAVTVLGLVGISPPLGRGQDRESRRVAAEHGWMIDYQAACQAAREQNKPLMVVLRCVP